MIFAYLVLSSSSIAARADPSFHSFFFFQILPLFGNIIYVFIYLKKNIIDPSGKPAMRSNRFLCWWVAASMAWTIGRKRRRFARVAAAAVATAAIVKRIDARVASIVASNRDLTAGIQPSALPTVSSLFLLLLFLSLSYVPTKTCFPTICIIGFSHSFNKRGNWLTCFFCFHCFFLSPFDLNIEIRCAFLIWGLLALTPIANSPSSGFVFNDQN